MTEPLTSTSGRDQRRHQLYALSAKLGEFRQAYEMPADRVGEISRRLVDAWHEIDANWTPDELGWDETPEEREKYETRFIALGEAIHAYAELFLGGDL
jgi:hypothetical protein